MKIADHGRAALQAQTVLLQYKAARIAWQVGYLLVAAIFGFFAVISGHALLWALFLNLCHFGVIGSSASVLGVDVFLAVVFAFLGRRSIPNPVEIEARFTRDRHFEAMKQSLAVTSLTTAVVAGPVGRFAGKTFVGALRSIFSRGR